MLAQDMLRFLDLLHIENVAIVGHSMGGDVAMSIAVLAPVRCRALVSIGSAGSRNPNLQHWLTRIGQGNKLEQHYPHFIRHLVQSHLSAHHGGWRNFLRMTIKNCMRWPNFSATDLMSLKMPFLLLHGSQDPFVNPDEVNNLTLHCPKFMEVSIAGAGHTPQGSSCTIKKTATTINNFLLNSQIID